MPEVRLHCTSPPFGRAGAPACFRASASAIFLCTFCSITAIEQVGEGFFVMPGSHHSSTCSAAQRTPAICLTGLLRTHQEVCAPQTQRAAALQLHSLHTFPGTGHLPGCCAPSTYCTLHLEHQPPCLSPPKREITHPTRRRKPHHRQACSVASKNKKLLKPLLLSVYKHRRNP